MRKNVQRRLFQRLVWGRGSLPAMKAMPKEMQPIVDKPMIQYIVEAAVVIRD